jgi:transposase-like protein
MASAVGLREDYSAAELRALARRSKNVNQGWRLLSLAAIGDGMDRCEAARIGGMDRQTLRDWVHRFNGVGSGGSPRQSDGRAEAASVVGSVGGIGADRRGGPGS